MKHVIIRLFVTQVQAVLFSFIHFFSTMNDYDSMNKGMLVYMVSTRRQGNEHHRSRCSYVDFRK